MKQALLIGTDPEFFLKEEGIYISAHGMIPGTKVEPFPVDKGAVQVDGMAVEFNTAPAVTAEEFTNNIKTVLHKLREMIPNNFEFAFDPVAHFDPEYLALQPHEAINLGCDPDFNAYTGEMNQRPDVKKPFRTAAGHLHLGWRDPREIDGEDHVVAQMVVRQLDFMLGIPSLLLDPDTQRRELYGEAGAYRTKEYGVEYRVLSNFWLKSPELIKWAHDRSCFAFHLLQKKRINLFDLYGNTAKDIINNNDIKRATKFTEEIIKPLLRKGLGQ